MRDHLRGCTASALSAGVPERRHLAHRGHGVVTFSSEAPEITIMHHAVLPASADASVLNAVHSQDVQLPKRRPLMHPPAAPAQRRQVHLGCAEDGVVECRRHRQVFQAHRPRRAPSLIRRHGHSRITHIHCRAVVGELDVRAPVEGVADQWLVRKLWLREARCVGGAMRDVHSRTHVAKFAILAVPSRVLCVPAWRSALLAA